MTQRELFPTWEPTVPCTCDGCDDLCRGECGCLGCMWCYDEYIPEPREINCPACGTKIATFYDGEAKVHYPERSWAKCCDKEYLKVIFGKQ
jgi:hypothetical protein